MCGCIVHMQQEPKFREWKAMVEKSSGRSLKAIRTDNGGEFTSGEFEAYLKEEGMRHELTIPKTPEQNGVAEWMNRTLVEAARSMLVNAYHSHSGPKPYRQLRICATEVLLRL